MLGFFLFLFTWFGFGVIAGGLYFANQQGQWREPCERYKDLKSRFHRIDRRMFWVFIPLGFSGFVAVLITGNFKHGWRHP